MAIITKDSLQAMLNSASRGRKVALVGRALTILAEKQTVTEVKVKQTIDKNFVGFSAPDAKAGTLMAEYFAKHGNLSDVQLNAWLASDRTGYSKICKYHMQLDAAARRKAG